MKKINIVIELDIDEMFEMNDVMCEELCDVVENNLEYDNIDFDIKGVKIFGKDLNQRRMYNGREEICFG